MSLQEKTNYWINVLATLKSLLVCLLFDDSFSYPSNMILVTLTVVFDQCSHYCWMVELSVWILNPRVTSCYTILSMPPSFFLIPQSQKHTCSYTPRTTSTSNSVNKRWLDTEVKGCVHNRNREGRKHFIIYWPDEITVQGLELAAAWSTLFERYLVWLSIHSHQSI